ncbi:post-transcriptional regulator [Enterococcus sp. LJL99]
MKKDIKEKCSNFKQQGYLAVDEAELLNYLLSYRWKKKPKLSIKECREDILHIKSNDFFDYQQLLAQTKYVKINDWHDLEDLF